jgi:outer membrane lipoprotein carrier protein
LLASFPSGTQDARFLSAKLEARYRFAHVMQATFLERYWENGRVSRVETGTAYFRRPGKMRWEYDSPEKNLFLVDGKMAWFYVPADHTATRVPAKQSADWRTPIALLAGEMKLSRLCARIEIATAERSENRGDGLLQCVPRSETEPARAPHANTQADQSDREEAFLEIVPDTGDLVRVLLKEKGGVALELKFANWRFDPPVPESLFRFEVPPGVAIVNGDLSEESRAFH